jgi:hypothetical protein
MYRSPRGAQSAVQIRQHERPLFGCDVFHCIDGHHGVEGCRVREILQGHLLEAFGNAASACLRQHPAGLIDPVHAVAGGCHEREVLAGAAGRIEHQ